MTTTRNTKQEARPIELADVMAGYDNPEWNGWGYLGERMMLIDTLESEAGADRELLSKYLWADQVAVELANEIGMTPEQFFAWMNSRTGRHFADEAFGSADRFSKAEQLERIRAFGLVRIIEDES